MDTHYNNDRRKFLRYDYDKPLSYRSIETPDKSAHNDIFAAFSKNLSASGLLFVTKANDVPMLSSLVVIDLDFRTANICQEIEKEILISNTTNRLIGKVVRIESHDDGSWGVGIAFVKKHDSQIKELEKYLN